MAEEHRRVGRIILIAPNEKGTPGGVATIVELIKKNFNVSHVESVSELGYLRFRSIQLIKAIRLNFCSIVGVKNDKIILAQASENMSFFRKLIYVSGFAITGNKVFIHVHAAKFDVTFFNRLLVRMASVLGIRLIVLSDHWKQRFHLLGANRVSVLVNPISSEDLFETQRANRVIGNRLKVAFVGRVGIRKGIDILLEALGNLDVNVDVFGDGELKYYESVAKDNNLINVKFHGWIDMGLLPLYLSEIDVLCLPSRNEGLPLSILEGMAAGLIIIASDIPAIKSVVGDFEGVFLFENENPKSLNKTLHLVSELSQEKLAYLSQSNRKIAHKLFHKNKFITQLNRILYEIK